MKYTGQLVTGDYEDNTMTFEIDGEMILQAGKYYIEQIQVGNQVKNIGVLGDVSHNEVELKAFLEYVDTIDIEIYDTMSHEDLIRGFKKAF